MSIILDRTVLTLNSLLLEEAIVVIEESVTPEFKEFINDKIADKA